MLEITYNHVEIIERYAKSGVMYNQNFIIKHMETCNNYKEILRRHKNNNIIFDIKNEDN